MIKKRLIMAMNNDDNIFTILRINEKSILKPDFTVQMF